MTELAWTATRADAIDRFRGQTPRPEDESVVIDVFEVHPQLVLRAIDETAAALDAGKVTWAWSVLRSRLQRGTEAIREATADTKGSKLKAVERAKQWIENAGLHYDQAKDIEAELFGDPATGEQGRLRDYRDDPTLRAELLDHWRRHRPRGEQAERDHEAWNAKCKADRKIILDLKAEAGRLAAQAKPKETTCQTTPSSADTTPTPPTPSTSPSPTTHPSPTSPTTTNSTSSSEGSTPSSTASTNTPDPVAVPDDNIHF